MLKYGLKRNGQHYDYVKRDILIDHVAVGSWQGRCSYPTKTWSESEARKHCQDRGGNFEPAKSQEGATANKKQQEEESEREKLRKAAEEREKRYGIKFREGKGHLTPPKDYPQDEEDYGDPANCAYPLVPEDRCRNALARWGAFREEFEQSKRNIIYERIVRRALRYSPELPEDKALPENIKNKWKTTSRWIIW